MIDHLIIKNFKCLENAKIKCAPLTLLAGVNGMGKSSVLQSLLLLRQSWLAARKGAIPHLILNGQLVNIGTAGDALCEGTDDETISLGMEVGGKEYIWEFCYEKQGDELTGAEQNPSDAPQSIGAFSDDFHYLRAERLGPQTIFPLSLTTVRDQRQLGRDGEFAPFFLATRGTEELLNDKVLHPNAASRQLRHQTEAWLGEISPGTRIYTEAHPGMDVVNLQYAFASNLGETNHYRASNVGFGITYCLSVIIAVLASRPGTLLLVENPEAHLHPRGQSQMGHLLALAASGGVQIFVETHSDHLLNGIRVAVHDAEIEPDIVALNYFEREPGPRGHRSKITRPIIDKAGRLSAWPDGFFDECEVQLRKLLIPPSKK